MWYMHDAGAGWWILMSLGMVGFWALVIWGIWSLARGGSRESATSATESPLEIIKRRLAHGEISASEYDALRDKLQSGPPAPA